MRARAMCALISRFRAVFCFFVKFGQENSSGFQGWSRGSKSVHPLLRPPDPHRFGSKSFGAKSVS